MRDLLSFNDLMFALVIVLSVVLLLLWLLFWAGTMLPKRARPPFDPFLNGKRDRDREP